MSEMPATRVEACIAAAMARHNGHSKKYFEDVHQDLAPLARQLERERNTLRTALNGLSANVEGTLGLAQDVLRAQVGNTNVAVIYHWLEQAQAALKATEAP
jgi:hypothetical protein